MEKSTSIQPLVYSEFLAKYFMKLKNVHFFKLWKLPKKKINYGPVKAFLNKRVELRIKEIL